MSKKVTIYIQPDVERKLYKLIKRVANKEKENKSFYGIKSQIVNDGIRMVYEKEYNYNKEIDGKP